MQYSSRPSQRGFTFIELIIAIVIVGILSVMGIASYTSSLRTGRDARRKADLDGIRNALELFKSNDLNGSYPDTSSYTADVAPYVRLPLDPKLKTQYSYTPEPSGCLKSGGGTGYCTAYTLSVIMEATDTECAKSNPSTTAPTCACPGNPTKVVRCNYVIDQFGLR
jgi:general secretion pathway protein G